MDLAEEFKHNYLFRGLTDAQREGIAAIASVKSFQGGDVILRQFGKDTDLMIVLKGLVRVNTFSGEKIAEGGPGCILGEISLLDDKPRSATVTSVGTSGVAVIPAEKFWNLMRTDAELAKTVLLNLGQVLCMRLRSANLQLDTVIGKDFAGHR